MSEQQRLGKLNSRQQLFCEYYIQTHNATQSAIKAGYSAKTAENIGCKLLRNSKVAAQIQAIAQPIHDRNIASGQEVMEFFTKMMNGEIKDAFGLDATNGDRIKAAQELAKRTVDIDNRTKGQADTKVEISIDWGRNNQRED